MLIILIFNSKNFIIDIAILVINLIMFIWLNLLVYIIFKVVFQNLDLLIINEN